MSLTTRENPAPPKSALPQIYIEQKAAGLRARWRGVKLYVKVWVVGFIAGAAVMGVGTWLSSRADSDETAERFVKLIESNDLMEGQFTHHYGIPDGPEEPLDVQFAKTGSVLVEATVNNKKCMIEARKNDGLFLVEPIIIGCNFKPGHYIKP